MAEATEEPSETQIENQPGNELEDPKIPWLKRVTWFLSTHWRGLVCMITPCILIFVLTPFPPMKYQWCAYTLLIMAIFWVTECVPLPVTSFLPIIIFPLTGVMDTRTTCRCYINDTVLMFYGSMVLAYAVEQSGLHQRLALFVIRIIGYSHYRLLFAMSATTMFISMWITNTAATTMMVPIIFAVLRIFENQNLLIIYETNDNGEMIASDVTVCYFCSVSFSATVGGIGTLVGTGTNLVFKGLFDRMFVTAPEYLSFPKFSAFSIPYMLMLEAGIYFYMLVVYFGFLRPKSQAALNSKITDNGVLAAKNAVEEKWENIGKITFWEIVVIILFSGAVLLFFCRLPQIFYGWGDFISDYFKLDDSKFVLDSAAALFVCFLMLLLPSTLDIFRNYSANIDELPKGLVPSVLNWVLMDEVMPYSFMFLLGGGFALSEAAKKEYSDLNGKIGIMLKNLSIFPNCFIMLLIIVFTVFITNFASNVAVCNVITPIVMRLAREINIHPLWYNITSGIAASFCFCLPVGTPGNLVIQSAANIPTMKMNVSKMLYSLIYSQAFSIIGRPEGLARIQLLAEECKGLPFSTCTLLQARTDMRTRRYENETMKAGIGPTVTTVLISFVSVYFWAPVIWPDLNKKAEDLSWLNESF